MIQSLDADVIGPSGLDGREVDLIVREVHLAFGGGPALCVGPHARALVLAFLRLGVDAFGLEQRAERAEASNRLAAGRFTVGDCESLPYEHRRFAVVVMVDSSTSAGRPSERLVEELSRVVRRSVYIRLLAGTAGVQVEGVRALWEAPFFSAGFRKHPSYYRVNDYEALEQDAWGVTLLLERIPDRALARYPLVALAEERDLHMDMLRENGARSDAHVFRYEWAARYVRPGDTVLDAACGLGYGSYLLQAGTFASRTIGIDGSGYAVEYARNNFSETIRGLEFREGFLPDALTAIPDHSIDLVVSFETLEHVEANGALLAEFHRILTPAGRIITSVPNDWSDETGEDPNPFHLHVYTLDRLRRELAAHFQLEGLVAQSASQHKLGPLRRNWVPAGRRFREVPVDVDEANAPDAEWWLCVAMRSPLEGEAVPYRETQFPVFDTPFWNVTAFSRDYRNPWLVRGMVDITHRLHFQPALVVMAESVLERSHPEDPDSGAALCVLGYRMLSASLKPREEVERFARRVDARLVPLAATPHGLRWQISLLFVVGRLWVEVGEFMLARAAFERCVALNPLDFSPLLCNRTVEARLRLGLLAAAEGEKEAAARHWREGIRQAREAVVSDWRLSLGNIDTPAEFALPELASVLEYASSCAYALAHIDDVDAKPGWWFQPLRDRLSQGASLRAELDSLRLERAALLDESKRFQFQLGEVVGQLQTYETYGRQLQSELEAYRRESVAYCEQLLAVQNQLRVAAVTTDAMGRELAAYREQSEAYQYQVEDASRRLQVMANQAQEQAAAYERRLRDVGLRLQEMADHGLGLQVELKRRQRESEEYARQVCAAEAASREAAEYSDALTRELAAYRMQAVRYEEQLGALVTERAGLVQDVEAWRREEGRLKQMVLGLEAERSGFLAAAAEQRRLITALGGELAEVRYQLKSPGFMARGLVRATVASIRRMLGGKIG